MGNIAIIIPARNEAPRLGAVLRTAVEFKKGSNDNVSIIVVDNDSTDGTPGVVRAAQKMRDENIVFLEEEKHGKKNVLMRGIEYALRGKPEIIVTLDADLKDARKEHIQLLIDGARQRGMSLGVLPAFLKGKSEALKQFRIEMSGQRAYSAEKLQELLNDEKIKRAVKHEEGYGFEAFMYEVFKKRFGQPSHVSLPGLGYVTKAEKGMMFPRTRNLIMNAQAFYYKWKARHL